MILLQMILVELPVFATFSRQNHLFKENPIMNKLTAPFALMLLILGIGNSSAQNDSGVFQWKKGQVLYYKVEHSTQALESVGDNKTEFKNQLSLTKKWQVEDVSKEGLATLSLSLESIKIETTTPKGDLLKYDSANPKEGTPQLKEQMEKFIGPKIATIVMDNQGRVRSVKESNFGSETKYEMELPFGIVVPPGTIEKGAKWLRPYQITLEPPQGTGEKLESTQKYECLEIKGNKATIKLTTELKNPPAAPADLLPVLPFIVEGDVTIDLGKGVMVESILKTDKTLKDHQGENSSYKFLSVFRETLSEKP